MKIIKPDNLSLLYDILPAIPGTYTSQGQFSLVLAAMAGFSFAAPEPDNLLLENIIWQRISESLPPGETLDQGLPKPHGEYLIYGSCWSRNPVRGKEIHVRIGSLEKRLRIFGPRFWHAHGPTKPQPYTRIAVHWQHAFGGANFPENPLGMGHARLHRGVYPLPLVEDPRHLVAFTRQKVPPAGLTAIPGHWPQRRCYLGTVDAAWLERNWPGLPADYQPEYACTAPPDQRFSDELPSGLPFAISGMHPERETITGTVPKLRARLFVQRGPEHGDGFEEIICRPETLWLFPDSETGVILFRGVTWTRDEEGAGTTAILASFEHAEKPPLPAKHYEQQCALTLNRGQTSPAKKPDDIPPAPQPRLHPNTMAPTLATTAGIATVTGLGPAAVHAQANDPSSMESLISALEAEVTQHLDAIGVSSEQTEMFLQDVQAALPEDMPTDDLTTHPLDDFSQGLDQAVQNMQMETNALLQQHGLTPESLEQILTRHASTGEVADNDFLDELHQLQNADDLPQEAREGLREALNGFAQSQAALALIAARTAAQRPSESPGKDLSPTLTMVDGPLTTDQALERHAKGLGLAGCDLTGCDFTGRDLSGANLRKAVLDGVSWSGAILTRADLRGAFCRRADFSKADLTGANLSGAVLETACLNQVQAQGCVARRARLQGADLRRANLSQADFQAADCSGSDLRFATMTNLLGRDMRLNNAQLEQSQWTNADLSGSRADTGTNGTQACFVDANLKLVRWSGAHLPQADFTGADLDGADLSKTCLRKAIFRCTTARNARLIKADLRKARFRGVNLFQASLRHANCTEAHIEDVNLFGADLYRCKLDKETIENANLRRTILQPGILEQMA